ncbi:pyridine nucleotide-disulfide oxidoreductase [Nocardioides silvaticus]|uniref:Pyridine nucleotide-disulfide oxidoreductase n=2 Tax=Nocardioides silvaticus TaxID=2201891 RepID=A0A316TEY2_9ACTN|nr:pyridine nucleotide-disulfide oxidoreductase [Nocardioides silvaticus]
MPRIQPAAAGHHILVEAEEFDDFGGWTLDSQFETEMGSPYLLAHGLGVPVADATTTIDVERAGSYRVWVRSKDWVPTHHPGRFAVSVNGQRLPIEFGAGGGDWGWEDAGRIDLGVGRAGITLTDLTGFDGRCDAIYLTTNDDEPPNGADPDSRAWRRRLRGLPDHLVDGGSFDLVVTGGGVTGSAAALAAGRLGLTVALIHNRPVLGGNASTEIGLTPRGETGPLIKALSARSEDGDLAALDLLRAEPTVSVFLEHQVFDVLRVGDRIVSVDAREARSGRESRFRAEMFIDCTGTAILGLLAGAETMFGYENRAEYGEPLAPDERVESHHGNTLFFRTRERDHLSEFPDVPWAVEVAHDYANLGGQLERPGVDNVAGPVAGPARIPDPSVRRRMLQPLTHFWEYGHDLDPYTEAEHIRDHLLRAVYGTFSNVKTLEPETHANLALDWVAFVPGQGEFRRYKGAYVLTENDIREHRRFDDTVVWNSGAFCLHHPGHERYDFRLRDWTWDTRDGKPFAVPFRCLYSIDLDNLMMAGKHISVTHIAGSVTKFMGNGGQHAIATAAAAELCRKYDVTPRELCDNHLDELRETIEELGGSVVSPVRSTTGRRRPSTRC